MRRGETLVILLAGGDKRTQDRDIELAIDLARRLQETEMAKTRTAKWDPAEHLHNDADMAAYLEAALEEGDPALVAAALGDIARAKGMSDVARDTGLGRESLYKALSAEGNPELSTILKVVKALGLRFHAAVAKGAYARDSEHVRELLSKGAASAQEPAADAAYFARLRGRARRRARK